MSEQGPPSNERPYRIYEQHPNIMKWALRTLGGLALAEAVIAHEIGQSSALLAVAGIAFYQAKEMD